MDSLPGVPNDNHSHNLEPVPSTHARTERNGASEGDIIRSSHIELSTINHASIFNFHLNGESSSETPRSRVNEGDLDSSSLLLREANSSGSEKSIVLRRRNARFLEATERMLTNSQNKAAERVWNLNGVPHSSMENRNTGAGALSVTNEDGSPRPDNLKCVPTQGSKNLTPLFQPDSPDLSSLDLGSPAEKEVHFIRAMMRDRDSRLFLFMMCLTGSYMIVELVVGFIISSLALQADGFHMASDLASLFIGAFALMASKRKHTPSASFGFARYEVVGALVNAVFLMALSLQIALEAISRLLTYVAGSEMDSHGGLDENSGLMLYVGLGGLLVNIIGLIIFSHGGGGHGHSHGGHGHSHGGHGHSHAGHGHSHGPKKDTDNGVQDKDRSENDVAASSSRHKSSVISRFASWWEGLSVNIQGVILHVLGDFLGSIAVIVSGVIMRYTDLPHKELSDPFCSLIIVVIILAGTVPLVRGTVDVLLQKVPPDVNLPVLKDKILKIPGVLNIHEFHVWQLSGITLIGSLHVILDRRARYRDVSDAIKLVLHDAGVHASTLQPEFVSVTIQKQIEALETLYLQAVESLRQSELEQHKHCSLENPMRALREPLIKVHTSEEAPSEPEPADPGCVAPDSCPVNFSKILKQLPHLHLEQHLLKALMPTMPISQIRDILNLDMCDEMVCSNECEAAACCPATDCSEPDIVSNDHAVTIETVQNE